MSVEIRAGTAADLGAVDDIRAQAYARTAPERLGWTERALRRQLDRWHVATLGGRVIGCLYVHPLGQFFGGRSVPMGGVASVAVAAEERGRGAARLLVLAALDAMHERGEVISSLHPATTGLYRRFGWEVAGDHGLYEVPTRSLADLEVDPSRRVRRGVAADLPRVRACYAAVGPRRPGWIDRPDPFWSEAFSLGDDQTYLAVVEPDPDAGVVDGYARYRQIPGRDRWGYAIVVDEIVARDAPSARALYGFFGATSAQAKVVTFVGGSVDALARLLAEQDVHRVGGLGWMTRVVDAVGAIEARGYPAGTNAAVDLELRDAHAPWNDGRWVLDVEGGEGRLRRGGAGVVQLTAGGLATLYTGAAGAFDVALAGLVGAPPEPLAVLDAVFSGARPTMLDDF